MRCYHTTDCFAVPPKRSLALQHRINLPHSPVPISRHVGIFSLRLTLLHASLLTFTYTRLDPVRLPNIAINRLFLNLRSFRPDSSASTSSTSETVTGFECYPNSTGTHTELSTMPRSPRRPGKKVRRVSSMHFARAPSAWVGSMSMSRGTGTSGTLMDIEA